MSIIKHTILLVFLVAAVQFTFSKIAFGESSFPDLPKKYEDEINFLIAKEIIMGFSDGTFKPNDPVTRDDATAMIGRALQLNGDQTETEFSDVRKENHASGYIKQAVEQGIIQGFPDGTFKPSEVLTRGQMSAIISRAFPDLKRDEGMTIDFHDLNKGYFAYDSIQNIAASGITNGYPDHTFRPSNDVTRLEMALFLARALYEDFRVEAAQPPPLPTVAKTKTAKETDQIVTVVSTGGGHADIEYWKKTNGVWKRKMFVEGFVGSNGVSDNKVEGDRKTPTGSYAMPFAFGTENPGTKIDYWKITNTSYWISNVNDPQYNTWQERSTSHPHDEHLIAYRDQYKYAIVIDYNMEDPVPGKGSAIFLHVSNSTPTLGCVSVPESKMRYLMQELGSHARIIIAQDEDSLLNY
ncbi:S-layer homology domain-containing protein [Bacillus shivajii]|uniref:S-layer homology domain-containing protein n=1 Tax=Bacillus shivajii TaxID=1983719 RepID=UPI001CFBA6B0|nr:S-layer homology domain-containing protein [Bacillus shivajii]UCZ52859.1 S-layer homology domain-containing protein [Bacillus shivajii]